MTQNPSDKSPVAAHRASPFIMAKDAAGVMAFIEEVFDAKPLSEPLFHANGDLWNAELEIGSSTILLGEASDGMALPGFVFVYVDDPDATHAKAIAQGAEPVMPIADQFYGHRDGGVKDPFGNLWWIGKKTEDVPFDELKRRAAEVDDHR